MRAVFWLVLIAIVVLASMAAGDRYGLPEQVRSLVAPGFEFAEENVPFLNAPDADGADEASAASEDAAPARASRGEGVARSPAQSARGAGRRINAAGLEIIKVSEGLRLDAYRETGAWRIGYDTPSEAGETITEAEAEARLRAELAPLEEGVARIIAVPMNDNEFSALVSFAYTFGLGRFAETDVVTRLNAGDRAGAAEAILRYDRARINGELRTLAGLTRRRERERALFLTPA